jgi:TetR/AcrR family transcriptional repressor of nem operon
MPWKKEHKSATRGRILETAATAIRAKGVAGLGVAQVMAASGLTHGGFYAHFGSKEDLVASALAHACEESRGRLQAAAERAPEGEGLQAVANAYLTAHHMRHPETGCPIAAVGPEIERGEGSARQAYAEYVRGNLDRLEAIAPGKTREQRRRAAAGTYATMIGALLLARALGEEEGEKFLSQARRFLRDPVQI